jgi:putative heme-binding domain-containing protein
MFTSIFCINCHHFGGTGGNTGPDLTGAGNRYTVRDLTENILNPSKVVSDQYPSEIITLKTGGTLIGRVVVEENNNLFVMTSAFAPNALTTVADGDITDRKPNPVSMMPPGLLNALNPDELLDLYAYILSGGNPEDPKFKK